MYKINKVCLLFADNVHSGIAELINLLYSIILSQKTYSNIELGNSDMYSVAAWSNLRENNSDSSLQSSFKPSFPTASSKNLGLHYYISVSFISLEKI